MTYNDVLNLIKAALSMRPAGTQVQVADHEAAEIAILDYVQANIAGTSVREAHASIAADTVSDIPWSAAFDNTNYSFSASAWDAQGNPVPLYLRGKTPTKITVLALTDATVYAIGRPFNLNP